MLRIVRDIAPHIQPARLWRSQTPSPTEARKKVGEKITVEMKVQAAKDRLEARGGIYLDAESEFRDDKNFAVVITKTVRRQAQGSRH